MTSNDPVKTLKGSQLGYRGKGVPDVETILRLQKKYSETVLARGLLPDVLAKYERMQELHAKAHRGKEIDEKAMLEAGKLAAELAPTLHFKVDDVDWDK